MSPAKLKIFAISGSTRKASTNLNILKAIGALYQHRLELTIFNELEALPHFNPDLDKDAPPAAVALFREQIRQADGVLFCTPEYVFSLPGSLKNAIEWTVSTTLFSEKPVAIITASTSGEKAHESLQLIMRTIYAQVDDQACLLIKAPKPKVNTAGQITDATTLAQVHSLMDSFIANIQQA